MVILCIGGSHFGCSYGGGVNTKKYVVYGVSKQGGNSEKNIGGAKGEKFGPFFSNVENLDLFADN